MTSRTSAKFGAAIANARRSSASTQATASTKRAASPSSSELSSPPPSSPEAPTASKHFPKRARVKTEPGIKPEPQDEPPQSMGDIPAVLPELPAAPRKPTARGTKKQPPSTAAPAHWEEMYQLTQQMRAARVAPVDTMGCERLADRQLPAKVQRFQTLVSLMLSSQTKDTVTAAAVAALQRELPGGLTLDAVRAVEPPELNRIIAAVGFHRRKTEYIKRTADILQERWNGDIPDSVDGLMSLPGVGPKMAHLCMSAAWDTTVGIGVDVHVHRICNLWGWVESNTPEETRMQLEAWLPREKWREINWLLVGFGQTICLPRGRKCGECKLSNGLCRAAFKGESQAAKKKRVKVELKKEEDEDEDPEIKGDPDADFKVEGDIKVESPRRRPKRKVVKVVKTEDWSDEMTDIEDAGSS